jgi:hypothetical protein
MSPDTWAIVGATFLGPIFAVGITLWREAKSQKYNRLLYVFRTLMATRKIGISNEHVNALNLIEVDFHNCEDVVKAWKSYLEHLNAVNVPEDGPWQETKEKRLPELLSKMGAVLGFDIPGLDLFRGGYSPIGWVHKDARTNGVLEFFNGLSDGTKVLPIWLAGVAQQNPPPVNQPPAQPVE